MKTEFIKMHLLGNDFVIVDTLQQPFKPSAKLIRKWAHRQRGIGFDQLLLIEKPRSQSKHFYYRIFNANGNEVAQCGNGALCVTQYLIEKKRCKNPIHLMTMNNRLELTMEENGKVTANLGLPIFDPEKIPFINPSKAPIHPLETPFGRFDCCVLSLGNPHCVIQVNCLEKAPLEDLGLYLNQHPYPYFPQGCNLELMKIRDPKQIDLRIYERGVGETQACGSGACAAVIAGRLLNRLTKKVKVNLPGGLLTVRWESEHSSVFLRGTPTYVFRGSID
ncbi:diaminopimelate epimerase [Rickettsiella grylli]|uniref:diaminopimelate epimerase n=1 Tax=Rickettsiella grylli TaxID=59196 RepID=UPI0008FD44AE|nr:diaminopimelate epimerase [Rickettsiella grylli]OJA00464.1 diaminopimelate epimerase [Rickettsiella grylli]